MSRADLDAQPTPFDEWAKKNNILSGGLVYGMAAAAWQAAIASQAPALQQEPVALRWPDGHGRYCLASTDDTVTAATIAIAESLYLAAPSQQGDTEDALRFDWLGKMSFQWMAKAGGKFEVYWLDNILDSRKSVGLTPRAAIDAARKAGA